MKDSIFLILCLLVVFLCTFASNSDDDDTSTTTAAAADAPLLLRRRQQQDQQDDSFSYKILDLQEINALLLEWESQYPDFVHLTTAQSEYGLDRADGGYDGDDCPSVDGGCLIYILTIQNYKLHPYNSPSSNALPSVLLSGAVHGNERVGPTAVMHAAELLLQAADCAVKQQQDESSSSCQESLSKQGISSIQQQWLARLLSTRRIVILPTANAQGYCYNQRGERVPVWNNETQEYDTLVEIDPNTDFPYDTSMRNPDSCMQTITARALNEVYRDHLFLLGLTFHAGINPLIGYEWGNPAYLGYASPDDTGQSQIAAAFSRYGGAFADSPVYDHMSMNDQNIWLHGAMEDWAYAASFDGALVTPCNPTTYNGYSTDKTTYNNSTLRSFTMLVETSLKATPMLDTLGTGLDVLNKNQDSTYNGHISRNVRLTMASIDLVEPYVSIIAIDEFATTDDIATTSSRRPFDRLACQQLKRVLVPGTTSSVNIRWTVGGALTIDVTSLLYAKWDSIPESAWNCMEQPDLDASAFLDYFLARGVNQSATSGTGYFHQAGPSPKGDESLTLGPVFAASVDLTGFNQGDEIVVLARARVDQSWKEQPDEAAFRPIIPPQSHLVNARTDTTWHHESAGKVVQGHLDWYTIVPLTLVLASVEALEQENNTFSGASLFGRLSMLLIASTVLLTLSTNR